MLGPKWPKNPEDIPKRSELEKQSWTQMIREWPKRTLCIVGNEFCERFSFYGMRTVLTLYLLNVLKYGDDTATMLYNGFTMLCYFTPMLGSILADGYIGKFKTILALSLLYTAGQCVLALAASGSGLHPGLDLLGLAIIAFGTGGIKPCVCSFGGDQFKPSQARALSLYFSAFYFAINAGAMISSFISPMFRATPCLGQDSCYPLAFGIPAALMVVATLLFMSASCWYRKPPPERNIFVEVYTVVKKATVNKWRSKLAVRGKQSHWLDHYFDTHFCESDLRCEELQRWSGERNACQKRHFVADVKSLLRLLVMYTPAPMFWALYDQQGSRWLIQSLMMDCRLWGDTLLLPDQMQTLNSVLILCFIPLFQLLIYPFVSLFFNITPLRKMVSGGLLAALAFLLSATVQFRVNTTLPETPPSSHSFVSVMNSFDNCSFTICSLDGLGGESQNQQCRTLGPNQTLTNMDRKRPEMFDVEAGERRWRIRTEGECAESKWGKETEVKWKMEEGRTGWMMVGPEGVLVGEASTEKPRQGMGEFSVGFTLAMADIDYAGNLALCRWHPSTNNNGSQSQPSEMAKKYPCDPRHAADFYAWQTEDVDLVKRESPLIRSAIHPRKASIYKYKSVRPGKWVLYLMKERPRQVGRQTLGKEQLSLNKTGVELEIRAQGGVYMVALTGRLGSARKRVFQVVPDNSVSILWQVPQIVVLTAAEILFSITGYEFAYSQAAPSMKSLVQALWLITNGLGDAIILLITLLVSFPNMAVEFLIYSAMMVEYPFVIRSNFIFPRNFLVALMVVLAYLAIFYYEYNYYTGEKGRNELKRLWEGEIENEPKIVRKYGTMDINKSDKPKSSSI